MASSIERLPLARPDQNKIQSFFNAITSRYDFLNSLFSLGLDGYWRRKMAETSLSGLEQTILDLGVGTGKSLEAFINQHQFDRAVGCDFSHEMLKEAGKRLSGRAELVQCDFHELTFEDGAFDVVTGSFMLRSVQNMSQFLSEVKRVLKPSGKAVFLELTRPKNTFIWNLFYRPYLQFYIPFMGKLFSKHNEAYQFLSESVRSFMTPDQLKEQFSAASFKDISVKSLSFGAVTIIEGKL